MIRGLKYWERITIVVSRASFSTGLEVCNSLQSRLSSSLSELGRWIFPTLKAVFKMKQIVDFGRLITKRLFRNVMLLMSLCLKHEF